MVYTGLGRRNASIIYPVPSNVSLTTKSSKSSLWVATVIFLLASHPVIWHLGAADAKHEDI